MTMFSPGERERVRDRLLEEARSAPRITGAALTGSAAAGSNDRWSDIDLAFGVRGEVAVALSDWTRRMIDDYAGVHLFDLPHATWIYRVFLLPGCLEVDLAFAPEADFGALGPNFLLVHGDEPAHAFPVPPSAQHLLGMGAHHALHARAAIARGRWWQAEYWVTSVRNQALALACLQLGQESAHGRGADRLPAEVLGPFEDAMARTINPGELGRALGRATELLLVWGATANPGLVAGLKAASLPDVSSDASPEV